MASCSASVAPPINEDFILIDSQIRDFDLDTSDEGDFVVIKSAVAAHSPQEEPAPTPSNQIPIPTQQHVSNGHTIERPGDQHQPTQPALPSHGEGVRNDEGQRQTASMQLLSKQPRPQEASDSPLGWQRTQLFTTRRIRQSMFSQSSPQSGSAERLDPRTRPYTIAVLRALHQSQRFNLEQECELIQRFGARQVCEDEEDGVLFEFDRQVPLSTLAALPFVQQASPFRSECKTRPARLRDQIMRRGPRESLSADISCFSVASCKDVEASLMLLPGVKKVGFCCGDATSPVRHCQGIIQVEFVVLALQEIEAIKGVWRIFVGARPSLGRHSLRF